MKKKEARCRGCGGPLEEGEMKCPVCNVGRRSDIKRPQVAAYIFFLVLSFVCGVLVYKWLQTHLGTS